MYNSFNCTNLLSMLGTGYGSFGGYGSYGGIGTYNLINSLFSGVDGRSVFATCDSSNYSIKNNSWSAGSIIGLAFGLATIGVGSFMGITALNNHRTRQAEQQNAVNTVTNNSKKIETLSGEIDNLKKENETLENITDVTDANSLNTLSTYFSKEVTDYKNAKSAYDSKKNDFDNLNATSASESNKYKEQIAKLKKDAEDTSKTDDQRKAAEDQIDVLEKKWAEEKIKAESELEKAEKDMNTAKTKLEEAIANKIAANKKAIEKKQAEMERLQKEAEEVLQSERLSRKCDEEDEFKKIIDTDENGRVKTDNNGAAIVLGKNSQKDIERAFNYKFREYCNCDKSDNVRKEELRQDALAIYKKLGANTSEDIQTKYKILMNGQLAFGAQQV